MSSMGGQEGGAAGMQGLLQAGQQLASQMQNSNPDLVDQLRRNFPGGPPGGPPGPDAPPGDGQNNDQPPPPTGN